VDMIDRSLAWAYGNDLISDRVKEPKTMVRTAPTVRTVSTDEYELCQNTAPTVLLDKIILDVLR
jgi:hypothetical protein